MGAKTNIVYLVLDDSNNPIEFAAVDADEGEYIQGDNLDPQTRNVTTSFASVSAVDTATRAAVTDNSGAWTAGGAPSADGFTKWNQTTTDTASVSGNIATNAGNITTLTASNAALNFWAADLGNVSANIATNTALVDTAITTLSPVSATIATNTGNITTNTNAVAVLDDDVNNIGTVSANIATNTGNITTLTASNAALNFWAADLGNVSGNIATNTGNIATESARVDVHADYWFVFSPVSANIALNAADIDYHMTKIAVLSATVQLDDERIGDLNDATALNLTKINVLDDDVDNIGTVSANIATNTALIGTAITTLGPVSGNIAINTGRINTIDGNITTLTASNTALNFWAADLGDLSGAMILTRGGGNLSAVDVCAAGEATLDNAVPTFKMGANKIAWQKPAFIMNPGHTAIEVPDTWGTNLTLNLMTGGVANIIASGIEAKSIETNTFTTDNITASAHTLHVGASLGCPIPNPFGYIQLTSDDVASSDEKHVGYSNTPTSVLSDTDHISWDDSAKNFVVKFAGTYEVVARIFLEGGSTLVQLHVNKEGSPVNTADPRAHTTVDPVERTISAIFTCAIDDVVDVTYEATSAQTTAAQIGTTVTIKRLK